MCYLKMVWGKWVKKLLELVIVSLISWVCVEVDGIVCV